VTAPRPTGADVALAIQEWLSRRAAIGPRSRRARRFAAFGRGSAICFPPVALYGEAAIRIGEEVLIGPYVSLSAGMAPGQELISDEIVTIGDRSLIGRNSSIVGHLSITIGPDVYFGPNVYVTDQNHGVDDPLLPIGRQAQPEAPVVIGAGSWLGTNSVVLPGVTIGRHVAVGAGSVVTSDLPDRAVAAGAPARVIRIAGSGDDGTPGEGSPNRS
jgi:acetyltransferase-like isoleucine patch superfamily enzyme